MRAQKIASRAVTENASLLNLANIQNAYKMTTVQNEYLAPEACGWRRDAIDLVAKQFAKALGFSCGDDIEPIVGQLGGKIEYEDFSLDEAAVAGWIEVDGVRNFKIRLNNEANSARDRFTIAHEIGHYVLHYLFALEKRGQFKLSANLTAQSEEGVSNPENEANYFALAFLMPSEEFGDYYNSVKNSPNGSLELTASKFGVPTWAAEFRAKSMSLI